MSRLPDLFKPPLNPIQRIVGDGCNFNRDMRQLIEGQFSQVKIETFPEPRLPAVLGYFYKGSAVKQHSAL